MQALAPGAGGGGQIGYESDIPLIQSSGFAHVRLTVTDITRSKAFYDRVFGWPVAIDASGSAAEPGVSFQDPDDINVELTAPLG